MNLARPKVSYIKSAVFVEDFPKSTVPEVAFVGRSNAGKSSLLNALAQSDVAKVSQAPGKTRLLNFFKWDETHGVVDVPGYGFARRSGKEQNDWQEMIENYLHYRENLTGLILVFDVRRSWAEEEQQLLEWWEPYNKPLIVALNKMDQLNQKEKAAKLKEFAPLKDHLELFWVTTKPKKGQTNGIDELRRGIFERMIKGREIKPSK
ncbi:MAG: ribosome biogenesis GTP-binding protein YihA/YsxC [Bdellovibrionota bacterium]